MSSLEVPGRQESSTPCGATRVPFYVVLKACEMPAGEQPLIETILKKGVRVGGIGHASFTFDLVQAFRGAAELQEADHFP